MNAGMDAPRDPWFEAAKPPRRYVERAALRHLVTEAANATAALTQALTQQVDRAEKAEDRVEYLERLVGETELARAEVKAKCAAQAKAEAHVRVGEIWCHQENRWMGVVREVHMGRTPRVTLAGNQHRLDVPLEIFLIHFERIGSVESDGADTNERMGT